MSEINFLIPKTGRNAQQRKRDKQIEAAYRAWISDFALCVKCLSPAVDLMHIRGYAQGYMKPPPEHTAPGCRRCHERQETNRDWWSPLTVEEAQAEGEKLFGKWKTQCPVEYQAQLIRFHESLNK